MRRVDVDVDRSRLEGRLWDRWLEGRHVQLAGVLWNRFWNRLQEQLQDQVEGDLR